MQNAQAVSATPFEPKFKLHDAYSTINNDGTNQEIDYLVDGLLTKGGTSIIAGKPKASKSCLSRHLAFCVSSGKPFLDRAVERSEVLLLSLEDNRPLVRSHLQALGGNTETDERIYVLDSFHSKVDGAVEELSHHLNSLPKVKLVIIDLITKTLGLKNLDEYAPVQAAMAKYSELAKATGVHIMGLVHAKKTAQDDDFDGILGSSALRGGTDTNIIIGIPPNASRRTINSEVRCGYPIQKSFLESEALLVKGTQYRVNYGLGDSVEKLEEAEAAKKSANISARIRKDIIGYLQSCDDLTACHEDIKNSVTGNGAVKGTEINALAGTGVLTVTTEGKKRLYTLQEGLALNLLKLGGYSD